MKTTNYEISKQLAEAGFKGDTNFYWYCYDRGEALRHISEADGRGNFKSYDLEMLLEALPREDFIFNWNATHKKPEEKFEASPFVWVINFEVVK